MRSMNDAFAREIRESLSPLAPIPSGMSPRGSRPRGIRAILFDIYGTLLISGTGDISLASLQGGMFGMDALLRQSGFPLTDPSAADIIPDLIDREIQRRHAELRDAGTDYPEVEIRDVWRDVLIHLWNDAYLDDDPRAAETDHLALRHELGVNPVWPMPGFPEVVVRLAEAGYRVGIVSNAQFYTPLILEVLADATLEDLGFEPGLCSWSYALRRAKPSPDVFSAPLARLNDEGVVPSEVLYVGNDMLNDVAAASRAGCRTCLFAGDRRSLRLREGDSRADVEPDMIITELAVLEDFVRQGGNDG